MKIKILYKPLIAGLFIVWFLNADQVRAQVLQGLTQNGDSQISVREYNPKEYIHKLDKKLKETSGLIQRNGYFYTHNDSGGEPEIYGIDTTDGSVNQTIRINNAVNTDWEDIATDDKFLYIGNFGNNSGNRIDLCIYRVLLKNIPVRGDATVPAEKISFRFEDQVSFETKNRKHNFDCESMISYNDQLILFTKNWGDNQTRLYSVPKNPGNYKAAFLAKFDAKGLVTGADLNKNDNTLALCGYSNYMPFIWLINDFTPTSTVGWQALRLEFQNRTGAQTEGICFGSDGNIYISSEETGIYDAKMYKVNYQKIKEKIPEKGEEIFSLDYTIIDNTIRLLTECPSCKKYDIDLLNRKGENLFHKKVTGNTGQLTTVIPLPTDEKGLVIRLKSGKKTASAGIN